LFFANTIQVVSCNTILCDERVGSLFAHYRGSDTAAKKRKQLRALVEGLSLSSVEDVLHVEPDAVSCWIHDAYGDKRGECTPHTEEEEQQLQSPPPPTPEGTQLDRRLSVVIEGNNLLHIPFMAQGIKV
jgi:hypothetical protein